MKNVAIIVAAGKGKRMGAKVPKQYLKVAGKEMLAHAIDGFEEIGVIDAILLVVEDKYMGFVEDKIVKKYGYEKVLAVIEGGKHRFESVYNAMKYLKKINPVNVLIHDAARPLIDQTLVLKIVKELKNEQAVIPVKRIFATVKMIGKNYVEKTVDREFLRTSQTPQGFRYKILLKLYNQIRLDKTKPTDEGVIFERAGYKVKALEDDSFNLKITTEQDLNILKQMLEK